MLYPVALLIETVIDPRPLSTKIPYCLPVKHSSRDLNPSDIDEMLAVVELTKPGPFSRRAPELGLYLGIHEEGQLVTMAGERLRLPVYTEISAVLPVPKAGAADTQVPLSLLSSRGS